MTWRMRFDAFPNAYNCYSWGEEVLRDGKGTVPPVTEPIWDGGLRSWVYQEMTKGDNWVSGGGIFHHGQGGWHLGNGYYGRVDGDEWVPYYDTRAELLAEAIPAYSFAAGANPMIKFNPPDGLNRNISMMRYRTDEAEWPPDGIHPDHRDWLHSDVRDVGYLHTYKLFDKFVEISGLK